MARMRRRFADRDEAAKANANRFGRERSGFVRDALQTGIMNPNLRPAVGNTAGRGRGTYTKTPMGSYEFSPVGITRRPTKFPEEYEGIVGQNKNWLNRIGGALKNEFGGSAMAGELMDMRDLRGQEKFSAEELMNLGLSGSPEGALADENFDYDINPNVKAHAGRTMVEDAYEQAVGTRNFVDPELSALLGKDYMVNYPKHYQNDPNIMKLLGSDMFGAEQTRGPVGQGFYPPGANKNWSRSWGEIFRDILGLEREGDRLFNRGGIASLRR